MQKRLLLQTFTLTALLLTLPGTAGGSGLEDGTYVPDQLLVKFRAGTGDSVIAAINQSVGGNVKERFRGAPDLRLIQLPVGTELTSVIRFYELQPEVDYAEPNHLYHITVLPDDTRFGELWGMHNTGQSGGLADFDIDAPEAWDVQTDASSVVIGSIDTGVDKNHEDLLGNIWTNPGEIAGNGVDDDNNGFVDDVNGWDFVQNDNNPLDDNSHGSHTMGSTTAVGNNGKGVAGVAWSSQIMIIKVCNSFGSCPTNAIINGIDYATDNGAHITSNSYGGGGFNQSMKDAIGRANAAGSLFSAAAGNNGRNTDNSPFYPASYDDPNIISVANMNRFGNRSSSSNYGATTVDLGAPGSSILSTNPNNQYGTKSGTSMACPHVTGALALMMGFNPTLGHLEYKDLLLQSVDANSAMQGASTSNGVLNVRNALDALPPLVIPPENVPPSADAGGPYKGRAGQAVTFDGSGSSDPNAPGGSGVDLGDFVSTYVWDFGDGTVISTSSPTTTHTYAPGNNDYTVTLTVKDKFRVESGPSTSTCRIRGGGGRKKK
jgi:subtilisin family serine protease